MDANTNIKIFNETLTHIQNSKVLSDAVKKSISQTIAYADISGYEYEEDEKYRSNFYYGNTEFVVSPGKVEDIINEKSFTVAQMVAEEGKKTAVLNMANPFSPGGGVKRGAQAQEEDLCRCSTLAPVLYSDRSKDFYYERNEKEYSDTSKDLLERYSDRVLYSPGIIVIRNDRSYDFLGSPFSVDIITCAAPVDELFIRSHHYGELNTGDLYKPEITGFADKNAFIDSHRTRAKRTLVSALDHGADILVLGAIGCGAFCNNHLLVASAWGDVIKEYGGLFDKIYYAVYDPDGKMDSFVKQMSTYM